MTGARKKRSGSGKTRTISRRTRSNAGSTRGSATSAGRGASRSIRGSGVAKATDALAREALRKVKNEVAFAARATGGLMFPKPTPKKVEKAREKRDDQAARSYCRLVVWKRAGYRCESCGRPVKMASDFFKDVGQVHEKVSRAKGGDPTDPENCVLLCYDCHFDGPSGAHRTS
jgi:hypothetical protein